MDTLIAALQNPCVFSQGITAHKMGTKETAAAREAIHNVDTFKYLKQWWHQGVRGGGANSP